MTTDTVWTNAKLVLPDQVLHGTIAFGSSGITGILPGRSNLPSAIDLEEDYVVPGLVELHTDNVERHLNGEVQADGAAVIAAGVRIKLAVGDLEIRRAQPITADGAAVQVGIVVDEVDSDQADRALSVGLESDGAAGCRSF